MSQAARELVFVYGTLRRGGSNHFRMDKAERVGVAHVSGRLFQVDWYPGLVLDPAGAPVTGEVYGVSPAHLAELDAFEGISGGQVEGAEYRRVRATVVLGRQDWLEVWLWEWNRPSGSFAELAGGDWLSP